MEASQQEFCVEKLARYYIGMLVRMMWIEIVATLFGQEISGLISQDAIGQQISSLISQDAIVHHYFMDGAVHVCQTMGVCDAMRSGR